MGRRHERQAKSESLVVGIPRGLPVYLHRQRVVAGGGATHRAHRRATCNWNARGHHGLVGVDLASSPAE